MPGDGDRNRVGEAGIALLLAVWLLTLLAVVAVEFMASGRVKARAERNRLDALAAYALALAGYRDALAALGADLAGLTRDSEDRLLLHYRGVAEPVEARRERVALGDGAFSWEVADEDGKVSLNAQAGGGLRRLERLLEACGFEIGADRSTVKNAIVDWIDPPGGSSLTPAEEDYYRSLDPPYSCKDGPFDLPEELLLVRGMTPECFYGGDHGGVRRAGLRELVTACPVEELNLMSAPEAVLEALGLPRPARRTPRLSAFYSVTATGHPAGGAPPRTLRAVLERVAEGGSVGFRLVYWIDFVAPDAGGQGR